MGDMYTLAHKHGNRDAALHKLVWNVKKTIWKNPKYWYVKPFFNQIIMLY